MSHQAAYSAPMPATTLRSGRGEYGQAQFAVWRSHFATASPSTVRKKLKPTRSFGRAELLGFFVPASRLAYIRADAPETELGKHDRIIACAHRQRRSRIARFRRTLEYKPGRDQIASRSELLALFYEALDVLGIEPADSFAG
jgi:hypothetical protein